MSSVERAVARLPSAAARAHAIAGIYPSAAFTASAVSRSVGNPVADFSATFRLFTQIENSPRFPGVTSDSMPVCSLMSAAARVARGR